MSNDIQTHHLDCAYKGCAHDHASHALHGDGDCLASGCECKGCACPRCGPARAARTTLLLAEAARRAKAAALAKDEEERAAQAQGWGSWGGWP